MKVKPIGVGKRTYVSKKDNQIHTIFTVVFNDGDTLLGVQQVDGVAPVPGVDMDARMADSFEIRRPWTGAS